MGEEESGNGFAALLASRDLLSSFILVSPDRIEAFRIASCRPCAGIADPQQRLEGCRTHRCGLGDAAVFVEEQAWFAQTLPAIWPPSEVTDETLARVNEHLMRYGAVVPAFVRGRDGYVGQGSSAITLRGELHRALIGCLMVFVGDTIRIHADDTRPLAELGRWLKARRTQRKRWLARLLLDHVKATSERSQALGRGVPRSTLQARLAPVKKRNNTPQG